MKNILFYPLLSLIVTLSVTSCDRPDDDDVICDCRPVLVTAQMELTNARDSISLSYIDQDGFGGQDPVITGGILRANTAYSFSTTFFEQLGASTDDVTEEIREEGRDFFVAYSSGGLNFEFELNDADMDGNPIGLEGTLLTGEIGFGELQILLKNEPTKTIEGGVGGITDLDVKFNIGVE